MGDILLNKNNKISDSTNHLLDYDYLIKFLALGKFEKFLCLVTSFEIFRLPYLFINRFVLKS